MNSVGICDENNLFGALEFSNYCIKNYIQPIISTEFEKQGRVDYAQYLINLAIEYTYQLSSNDDIKKTLIEISFELSKQNKFDETFYLLWEM